MAKKKVDSVRDAAGIYARYSSHAQKDASIEQQVEECTKYAQANNLHVVEVYADRAITGKTDRRPNFQRMMKDAEKGKFAYVISWKSNRMGRNMLQAMMNEARLNEMGIRVLYTEEDFDDTAAGRFALRSMMNVNQFYSENMAEDIKRGLYDNASKCLITNGSLPFGYKKGEDGRYAIDEPKDEIVREIYTRILCGDTFTAIGDDLNARGIKTAHGKEWGKSSFNKLISNERYMGIYIYGDVRIEGGVPQIVDPGLFHRVQEVLKTKRNPRGRHRVNGDYLLTGKLFCGKCKSHMVGVSGTSRTGDRHYYYICQKKRLEKACDKSAVRRDWVEEQVATAIKSVVLRDDVVDWIADNTAQYSRAHKDQSHVAILEGQLADNKRATKNMLAAIEQGVVTAATKDRLLELEREQAGIVAKLAVERSGVPDVSREDVVAWLESFRDGDASDKKYQAKLFDTFLVAVYLYDDNMKIVFGFAGENNTITVPLDAELIDSVGEGAEASDGSYKAFFEPPKKDQANQEATIYMVGQLFVLVYPITYQYGWSD